MNRLLEESELQELKLKVRPLIHSIQIGKKMKVSDIAQAIGVSVWLLYKWNTGKSVPNAYVVKDIVEKLEKLLEKPAVELQNEYSSLERSSLVVGEVSSQVIIFLHLNEKTETYTGEHRTIGTITEVNGKKGIIAYKNDSIQFNDADGLIYTHDAGLEPNIKYGSTIAIRKINKKDYIPGYPYYIITASYQMLLRKMLPEKKGMVKLVSEDESRIPDAPIKLSQILAIFIVQAVLFKP